MNIFGYTYYSGRDATNQGGLPYRVFQLVRRDDKLRWSFCGYATREEIGVMVKLPENFNQRVYFGRLSYEEGDI